MRIVFLTDIHHAFRQVGEILANTEAELYLIAGDLVYRAFFRYETAWRFMELQQILSAYRGGEDSPQTLQDAAKHLVQDSEDTKVRAQAREYLDLSKKAETYLKKSYGYLEKILARYPDKPAYVIPGNYDMSLSETPLKDRDLHLRCLELDGLRIAGYGGANVQTPGMPDHLQVPFRETRTEKGIQSEALHFFRKERPNVLLVHQPPYGYLDYLPGYGHAGSQGIRTYVEEGDVKLVLSGHHHDQWGAVYSQKTCFFNPSSFGQTVEVSGIRPGGFFLDLIIKGGNLEVATLRQLERGKIYDLLDYRVSPAGMESLILDEKRYARLGGRVPKARHIRPIRQLQRIKAFFLGYETPETQELIRQLRSIYREIQKDGMEVAFDLLGSLSFGMAQKNSDMDLVVYLRSRDCVLDDLDACKIPRPLAAVFTALEERDLNVEVCDSLDLDRVRTAIEEEDLEDGQLQRFIFYRLVCRPVNLRRIKGVENLLLGKERFRNEVEKKLKEYLEVLVSSVRHVSSFEKYKARLRERGIPIAPDVEEAIRNYLRG